MDYNINNNEDDNNSTSADNRGKFSDRLKKIRRDRLFLKKKKNISSVDSENVFKTGGRNIFKIFLALPMVAYTALKNDNKKIAVIDNKKVYVDEDNIFEDGMIVRDFSGRKLKVNKIRELNIPSLRKKREIALRKKENLILNNNISDNSFNMVVNTEKEERIVKLQKEIVNLIKKQLVKNINELEILQSELYLIKMVDGDDVYLRECQEKIKEIKKLLSKISSLKEKFDYLKDTYDFEYIYQHGDETLVDKILELKDLCNQDDVRYLINNFKLLDEYKYLYLKIDKLQDDTIKYEDYKRKKEMEFKERDINFEQLKGEAYDIDMENKRYMAFIQEQELFLKKLEEKFYNFEKHEYVNYRIKGFNQLLANSFKYIGLMLLNPFKGFIPNIAIQTALTKNTIQNLYNNLETQEERRVVYETVDYSSTLSAARGSINDTLRLVNSTLNDISNLKYKYQQEFSKHKDSEVIYKDAIRKINKIENSLIGNKVKIELMQVKIKEKEKENKNKLVKVKKLNSSANN